LAISGPSSPSYDHRHSSTTSEETMVFWEHLIYFQPSQLSYEPMANVDANPKDALAVFETFYSEFFSTLNAF
jgi:hypothetical protein